MTNAALKIQEEVLEDVQTSAVEEFDELEAMFEELEADLTPAVESEAELVVEDLSEEEMIQAGQAAVIEEAKADALAEMDELSEPVNDDSTLATGAVNPAPAKKSAPVTKRISSLGMKKSEALSKALGAKIQDFMTLNVNDAALEPDALQAKIDAKLAEIDALPKKIQEKAVNFFAHLSNGAQLSNYTKMAIDILVKDGEISSKTLRDAYIARPYSPGTANSQCTQLMKLLVVLELAEKGAGKLTANPDSTLLPMFAAE